MAERKITWCCTNTLLLLVACHLFAVSADTNPDDTAALAAIYKQWKKTPPSWSKGDPCGKWEGVDCENSRVTSLKLSTLGLQGNLADVMSLSQLQVLDLSFNGGLGDSIPPSIGNLTNLRILILAGCNLKGPIPSELGNLGNLTFLALNNNKLTGTIPPSLGKLSELYWFDIAENMLTGPLPVSSASSPGLDMLLKTKHFHFNRNKLSGSIPPRLFSSEMILIHILFDGNQFSGEIPDTIGLVSKLEVLRLDRNSFSGSVPSSLGNLTHLYELNLAGNLLTGPIPDLTKMRNLNYVDLSYNSFDTSTAPSWFTSLHNLTTLTMESAMLVGEVPQPLFSLPLLQELKLKNNLFNETLDMGDSISPQLQLVDLEYNQIHEVTLWNSYGNTLLLAGNPVCSEVGNRYCLRPNSQAKPYSTRVANCTGALCPQDRMQNPQSCECAYPYQGILQFRAPRFSDLTNSTPFQALERNLWTQFGLTPGSVLLHNLHFDEGDYMLLDMTLFPSNDTYFNMSVVFEIGFQLNNHTFSQPPVFGPYVFLYPFPEPNGRDLRSGEIIGIATGSTVLVLALIAVSIYAIRQKKRAEKAKIESQPFGSWGGARGKDLGEAPQLKGSRWFSYEEVKKCTSNFSARNEIGSGGYGKVYRGVLPSGQLVAIKRAQQGSMQGGAEFKTEVELLSRVHHKNLVSLVGFCFDRDEQMLVYEFVPNGTLRDSLTGRSGIYIDWKRRLRITLGSARGLAYLHELADPPIIHRDVKSTNILLDESLTAKVADFGLSKLVSDSAKGHISTQVKGTLGYLDPDYYMTQQLSEKSDVYSFGVVMLELITGRPPIERGRYIVREVRVAIDKSKELYGLRGLLDPAIRKSMLVGFERFVDLAMSCVEEFAADRPSMAEVVKEIETILKNEGLNTDPASASTSAADFGVNNTPRHPYDEALSSKENSDAFSNSGGYALPTNVEPK